MATAGGMGTGRAVVRATLVGTVLQMLLAVTGHYEPAVARLFAVLGVLLSLVAGLLAGLWLSGAGRVKAALCGLFAGAACALVAIGESAVLKDVPLWAVPFGTAMSAIAGAIGGLLALALRRQPRP